MPNRNTAFVQPLLPQKTLPHSKQPINTATKMRYTLCSQKQTILIEICSSSTNHCILFARPHFHSCAKGFSTYIPRWTSWWYVWSKWMRNSDNWFRICDVWKMCAKLRTFPLSTQSIETNRCVACGLDHICVINVINCSFWFTQKWNCANHLNRPFDDGKDLVF